MTNPAAGHAQATLSGRELALQRRQAMALHGKAASRAAAQRAPRVASATVEPASSRVAPAAPAMDGGVAAAMSPARARRLAMSLRGKASGTPSAAVASRPAAQSGSQSAPPVQASQAQASQPATGGDCPGGAACTCGTGVTPPAAASQLGQGRRAAMQRRQAMATRGRSDAAQPRPSGRVRPREDGVVVPTKVEEGHTLAGQRVTGTQVERTARVTGNEPGSCRAVTGTEYIGGEQFDRLCATRPAPAAPKVLGGRTDRGQAFTGTLVDRPARVTGGEQGADRAVTGTRYLAPGVDSAPDKVGVTHTASGRSVTGTSLDAARRATGSEAGDCRAVTGTEYLSSEHFGSVCGSRPPAQPRKVSVMSSREGQRVTGSSLAQGAHVTGNEAGASRSVTGNQYFNARDFAAAQAADAVAAAAESSRRAGPGPKSCGDERQGCTHVTASNSVSIQSRPAVAGRQAMSIPARAVTGDRPGGGGQRMTGDERGACEAVTGTPYVGEDNRSAACPVPAPSSHGQEQASPTQSFSILTPGHAALGRERGRGITGSAMGTERITGPVNKAQGLITGTPEFRRHDVPQGSAAAPAQPQAASRLSGEGSQQGPRISGDVWMERSRVTGTEGPSARSRNPSMRGQPRGAASSAAAHRELERPQVAPSRVTGSSGNTERGAMVTVSGGARG